MGQPAKAIPHVRRMPPVSWLELFVSLGLIAAAIYYKDHQDLLYLLADPYSKFLGYPVWQLAADGVDMLVPIGCFGLLLVVSDLGAHWRTSGQKGLGWGVTALAVVGLALLTAVFVSGWKVSLASEANRVAVGCHVVAAAICLLWFLYRNTGSGSVRGRRTIDPNKWFFDKDTGEYYRITGRFRGQIIYDSTPYNQRFVAEYARKKEIRNAVISMIVLAGVFAYCYQWLSINWGVRDSGLGRTIITGFGAVASATLLLGLGLGFLVSLPWLFRDFVGPPPRPSRDREDVEDQKVHGRGGFADEDQLDRALGGQTQTVPQQQPKFRF